MTLALTIIAGILIVVLGLAGLWRDVQRGFLALVGTLLGVVVVQLWAGPWAIWLQTTFGWTPSTAEWAASSLTFVFVALFVGYGSGALISKSKAFADANAKSRSKAFARPAGALLGVLNGAIISSVLLRYASVWSSNETVPSAINDSFVLMLLIDWFRWFILGVAAVIGLQAFGKWIISGSVVLGRMAAARQQPAAPAAKPAAPAAKPATATTPKPTGAIPTATATPSATAAPSATPTPAPVPVASAPLTAEQKRIEQENEAKQQELLRRAVEKIDQRLGDPSSKT